MTSRLCSKPQVLDTTFVHVVLSVERWSVTDLFS
jgi:hypothetical protein